MPEVLRGAGYRTAMFGKWHLGCRPEHYPTRHGFDEYAGLLYSNDMRVPVVNSKRQNAKARIASPTPSHRMRFQR